MLLSLVDDGTLSLDEPIGPTLPWLTGPAGAITLRQLLSHTSGLPASVECAEPTPAACDAAIAVAPLIDVPGEGFHVTDLDAHVAARLAETAAGRPWPDAVRVPRAVPDGHGGHGLRRPVDHRRARRRSTARPPRTTWAGCWR